MNDFHAKLWNLVLCIECASVFERTYTNCPSCTCGAVLPLTSLIQPSETPDEIKRAEVEIVEFMGETWRFKRI